jgi:hypothetical protein
MAERIDRDPRTQAPAAQDRKSAPTPYPATESRAVAAMSAAFRSAYP